MRALLVVAVTCLLGAAFDGVYALSTCDVNLSGVSLNAGETYSIICPNMNPSVIAGWAATGDQQMAVYWTDGSNCDLNSFTYYPTYSELSVAPETSVKKLVLKQTWNAKQCVRIKNNGLSAMTNLRVKVEWYIYDFSDQFHLLNTGQYLSTVPRSDINVNASWAAGYTGTGVVVDICDDGLQANHIEISGRISLPLSYNYATNVNDPTGANDDTHGTGCGGVAAATRNLYCGQGAAYTATLAGHRIIFSGSTSANYIDALYNAGTATHISSNSWGPPGCYGREIPGCEFYDGDDATWSSITTGATSGRAGRGKVYVFAAGNEGAYGGDANQYQYTKNPYVMTIAGSNYEGQQAWYSNQGANLFVNAPTQGGYSQTAQSLVPGIITALGGSSTTACRDDFGGTSSATPLVAGAVAVLLSAKPTLTNRDVQYLVMSTATQNDPTHSSWFTNAVGIKYSRVYGFGRVNTHAAVTAALASGWTTRPTEATYTSPLVDVTTDVSGSSPGICSSFTVPASADVTYIENVLIKLSASFSPSVTELRIIITSPAGTVVALTERTGYPQGHARPQFDAYPLSTRAFWGETAVGVWTLSVTAPEGSGSGTFSNWQMEVKGYACASCGTVPPRDTTSCPTGALSAAPAVAASWLVTTALVAVASVASLLLS